MWPSADIEIAMSRHADLARLGVDVGRLRQGPVSTIVDFGKAGCPGPFTRNARCPGLDRPQLFGQNT
ncbi:MAG: hypothetical protein INR64_14560 [Caulobacteraceae bacterium]|nr:hypothetical protein [Caulobacter sp.]